MDTPIINIGGSTAKGTSHIKSTGNRIAPVTRVVIDGEEMVARNDPAEKFDAWLDSIKNKQAPAIDDQDYQVVADRWECHVAWVRAVFAVESAGNGFNADGSIKCLFERHVFRRQLIKAEKQGIVSLSAVKKALDVKPYAVNGLLSMKPGGYKGGIAEWQRIKDACCAVAETGVEFDAALNIALSSGSKGSPQIMGYHAQLLGFSSPKAMDEAFHQNEDEQLKGFCSFVEKNGLNKHLKAATGSKDPYPHIVKFGEGYNGKYCCDKNGKRKNYAAEIIRHYRGIAQDYEDFSSLGGSRTVQGSLTATAANTGTGIILSELSGLTNITETIKQLGEYKEQAAAAIDKAQVLTDKVGSLVAQNTEMAQSLSNNRAMIFFLIALLILSQFGIARTLWARITDRLRGYK